MHVLTPSPRSHHGVALVMVLWMLALLSVIAASMVFATRTDVLIAGNLASAARAEALADAGVARAIYEMARPKTTDPAQWKADGLPHLWPYEGAMLQVVITDESGKVDINAAPLPLLVGLFQSQGAADAEALAGAVIDWRDADDLRSLNGAEKEDYAAAGKDYVPANAPFETIDDLRQLLGMDDALFRRLEPLVTVHSYQAGVNTAVASRNVLLALPGTTPEQVDLFIEQRRAQLEQGLPAPPFPAPQAYSATPVGSAFSVQVEAVLEDNTRFLREAVVRLTAGPENPVMILAWRAPTAAASPAGTQGVAESYGQSH